ncbi:glycosyltransferase family 2 protein [Aquibium microcysteis]|uniref:glycosyltransferase family 2 protein n=1 Tax=Aquibium microcysteis TaxID=675281 RepID=UPI00165CFB5F|nr:glycosyltransferase family 2 protein [Aquibium microcysteis]
MNGSGPNGSGERPGVGRAGGSVASAPAHTSSTASALGSVSAFIICKNERTAIGACLDSLAGFGDVVIVDSGSTDGTLDLIDHYRSLGWPIRLFHRDWPGFAAQKQFALEQCRNEWCLSIDCDERLSDDLRQAMSRLPLDRPEPAAYSVGRRDWLPGYGYAPRLVHTHRHARLFRRSRARYDLSALLHEGLVIDGSVVPIPAGRLLHFRNLSVGEELAKANAYATLKARQKRASGERAGPARIVLRPLWRFAKIYLLQRYFLCGIPGFIYAALLGIYVFLTEAKLYRLQGGAELPEE